MSLVQDMMGKFKDGRFDAHEVEHGKCGYHIEAKIMDSQVREFAQMMLDSQFYLDFVTAVHVTPTLQIVYQYGHFDQACRVNVKAMADSEGSIPTIADIFHGANWHERETHDFYGVFFKGNPDLRTLILSEEDADLKPLLKKEDKLVSVDAITRKAGEEADSKPVKTMKEE